MRTMKNREEIKRILGVSKFRNSLEGKTEMDRNRLDIVFPSLLFCLYSFLFYALRPAGGSYRFLLDRR